MELSSGIISDLNITKTYGNDAILYRAEEDMYVNMIRLVNVSEVSITVTVKVVIGGKQINLTNNDVTLVAGDVLKYTDKLYMSALDEIRVNTNANDSVHFIINGGVIADESSDNSISVVVNDSLTIGDLSAKTTPVDADITVIEDSADSFVKKKLTWANIKATLKTYFDTLYSNKGILHLNALAFNAADSTTYYFGNLNATPSGNSSVQRMKIPHAMTIKSIYLGAQIYTTAASAENVSAYIRVNDTTDTTLSTTWQWTTLLGTGNVIFVSGLSIALAGGDDIQIKFTTPAWATNPVLVLMNATIYYETT